MPRPRSGEIWLSKYLATPAAAGENQGMKSAALVLLAGLMFGCTAPRPVADRTETPSSERVSGGKNVPAMPALRVADADDAPEKPPRTTSTPALQEQATLVDQHADVAVRGPEVLTSTTGIHDPVDLVRRKQAAESGDVAEQLALGVMYGNGEGVPEDLIEAVKWLLLAAKQGDANAQSYLGFMYGEGRGVQEDPAEAALS